MRRWVYRTEILKRKEPELKNIVVGNLAIGGSGKTPHVIYLAELLMQEEVKIAILSRGYGRKSKGYQIVEKGDSASKTGDEPQLIKNRISEVPVLVCEDRVEGIKRIAQDYPSAEVVLLDDGFQHLKLDGGLYILLSKFSLPYFKDHMFPTGRLRERRRNSRESDLVIFSGCSDSSDLRLYYRSQNAHYNEAPCIFSMTSYQNPEYLIGDGDLKEGQNVIAVSGIADNSVFVEHLQKRYTVARVFSFRDHHSYGKKDVMTFIDVAMEQSSHIICTEKDVFKLLPYSQLFRDSEVNLAVVRINVNFSDSDEEILREKILGYVRAT